MPPITYTIEITLDPTPVRGNVSITDDPGHDAFLEEQVLTRVAQSDSWAWCIIKVTAECNGFQGCDIVHCCTYDNEEDFRSSEQYRAMRYWALQCLERKLEGACDALKEVKRTSVALEPCPF